MYIKLLGSFLVIGSASAVGYLKAQELKERVKRLQELKRLMILMQGELRFHHAVLSEAFENVSDKMSPLFQVFLKTMAERLEDREPEGFAAVWGECSGKLLESGGFQPEDGQLLELLGSSLGFLDLEMQRDTLNLAIVQTEETICRAKELQKSRGGLYQTMGVTAGAMLTLMIV